MIRPYPYHNHIHPLRKYHFRQQPKYLTNKKVYNKIQRLIKIQFHNGLIKEIMMLMMGAGQGCVSNMLQVLLIPGIPGVLGSGQSCVSPTCS